MKTPRFSPPLLDIKSIRAKHEVAKRRKRRTRHHCQRKRVLNSLPASFYCDPAVVAGNYSCRVMHEIRLHLLVARLKKASYRLTFLLLKQRGFVWLCCKQIQQLLFCCIPDKVAARGGGGSVCCRIKLQEICKYYNLKARVKCPRNRSRSHSKKTTACVCVKDKKRLFM